MPRLNDDISGDKLWVINHNLSRDE